jgi:hypothetical protein
MLVVEKPENMVPFMAEEFFFSPERSDRLGGPPSFIFSEYR